MELLHQPRLAEARLADDLNELALAGLARAPSAACMSASSSSRPTNGVSARGAAAPSAAARPHDAIERHRRRHALELMGALVLGDEQPGRLPLHARGDEHRPRLGRGLHPRRDVRRVAEHFAGRVDDDGARVEADAGGKLGRARTWRSWR